MSAINFYSDINCKVLIASDPQAQKKLNDIDQRVNNISDLISNVEDYIEVTDYDYLGELGKLERKINEANDLLKTEALATPGPAPISIHKKRIIKILKKIASIFHVTIHNPATINTVTAQLDTTSSKVHARIKELKLNKSCENYINFLQDINYPSRADIKKQILEIVDDKTLKVSERKRQIEDVISAEEDQISEYTSKRLQFNMIPTKDQWVNDLANNPQFIQNSQNLVRAFLSMPTSNLSKLVFFRNKCLEIVNDICGPKPNSSYP